jgi:hypothetical protein
VSCLISSTSGLDCFGPDVSSFFAWLSLERASVTPYHAIDCSSNGCCGIQPSTLAAAWGQIICWDSENRTISGRLTVKVVRSA